MPIWFALRSIPLPSRHHVHNGSINGPRPCLYLFSLSQYKSAVHFEVLTSIHLINPPNDFGNKNVACMRMQRPDRSCGLSEGTISGWKVKRLFHFDFLARNCQKFYSESSLQVPGGRSWRNERKRDNLARVTSVRQHYAVRSRHAGLPGA